MTDTAVANPIPDASPDVVRQYASDAQERAVRQQERLLAMLEGQKKENDELKAKAAALHANNVAIAIFVRLVVRDAAPTVSIQHAADYAAHCVNLAKARGWL